jgi:hypothetical protein
VGPPPASRVRDVDRHGRILNVRRTVSSGEVEDLAKTSASRRQVPLSRAAASALDGLTAPLDTPLLFPAPHRGPMNLDNWRRREWGPAIEAAGIAKPARIYDTRRRSRRGRWPPVCRYSSWRGSWARARP